MTMMSAQIMSAIKTAKVNLGDLLRQATLVKVTGSTYAGGVYTPTTSNTTIEFVIDRFTLEERMAEGFRESDLKVTVFNNDAQGLVIDTMDQIVIDSVNYAVSACEPAYVGPVKAVFEVKLRK